MNAGILKRVVRAIADGSQSDLDQLAQKIIEAERRTGHGKLADQLQVILSRSRSRKPTTPAAIRDDRSLKELPLSRRHGNHRVQGMIQTVAVALLDDINHSYSPVWLDRCVDRCES